MSYVAFQYAEALFGLALEEQKVNNVLTEYQNFVESLDEDIYKFLNHPKVTKKDKKDVISKVVTDSLFKNFVFVLIDNSRMDYLDDCLNEFSVIVDNQNKVMKANVYSNKELTTQELKNLTSNLEKKHNRKVELTNIVDVKIIGGLKVEYEGNVLDDTINNYLTTLKNNLTR